MSERIVAIIFLILCLGQVWALLRGRLAAVIYYIWVATIQYFSVWAFVTLDTARVCGALLILGGFVLYKGHQKGIPKGRNRLFFFLAYIVVTTFVGSLFWPIEAMSGRSLAYGPLRWVIQVVNWAIIVGVGWQIALALREKGALEKLGRWLILLGIFHCSIALYQVVAFKMNLPLPGIRRVAVGVGLDASDPHLAIANIGGLRLYRVTSFAGEPRSLAAVSMLWISALITLYYRGRSNILTHLALFLSLLVLILTLSTSGWGTFFFCLALMVFLSTRQKKSRSLALFLILLLAGVLLTVDSIGWLPGGISVKEVFEERWTQRIMVPLNDTAVEETLDALSDNPGFIPFGTGSGGMSFYIAQNRGGEDLILASTVGWVNYLGDIGLVGIFLMISCMWGGIRNLLFRQAQYDDVSQYMSFMGCVFLCGALISAPSCMLACAFGFLLASQFRSQAMARFRILIRKTPQATSAENNRAHSY